MNNTLTDKFSRRITYVRLAVTDLCNLRCTYCMPENMTFLPRREILTYEELERLLRILAKNGVAKVRITGGEPFVRKDLMFFLGRIKKIPGITQIHITSNGVAISPHLEALKALGISGINLSLDTLDRRRFQEITRRDYFDKVMEAYHRAIDLNLRLKINMVVMDGINSDEIGAMAALAKNPAVCVRFIEEMPFNGSGVQPQAPHWDAQRILTALLKSYPDLQQHQPADGATSSKISCAGLPGGLGIIAGYTRTFCGSCNRLRINARGEVQTCLYGGVAVNLKEMLRSNADDREIEAALRRAVFAKLADGWEAQKENLSHHTALSSMSVIGG